MLLTTKRLSRYLSLQKKVNNYLIKLASKDRGDLGRLYKITNKSLEAEDGMRDLLEYLVERGAE